MLRGLPAAALDGAFAIPDRDGRPDFEESRRRALLQRSRAIAEVAKCNACRADCARLSCGRDVVSWSARNDGTAHDDIVNKFLGFLEGLGANVLDAVRWRLVHVHDHLVAELVR